MDSDQHNPAQRLADIVASRPPWHCARLSTILLWPTILGGWTAILSYAHYTSIQPGETPPPDSNVTYPHDTHHPLALDGEAPILCKHCGRSTPGKKTRARLPMGGAP